MRYAIALVAAFGIMMAALVAPVGAVPLRPGEFSSRDAVLAWISDYRAKRDLGNVPAAMRALSKVGALRDPESAGAFVGFLAGILASNPAKAEGVLNQIFPFPDEDQWAIVQAIAYSGLPDWKGLMNKFATRMPTRKLMIERYLSGKLPTLQQTGFPKSPGVLDKVKRYVTFDFSDKPDGQVLLTPSPVLLDVLWGYYYATGAFSPGISHIIALLTWSKERDDVAKLTLGGMAKFTLASNAARDPKLLGMLKSVAKHYPQKTQAMLNEVIEAAETVDLARIRSEALAAVEELKRKGPGSQREVSFWGRVGQGAIGLGCIAAAALGQVELGIPCVVGGAVSSAGLYYWDNQNK
jgi:hypothetical protein